jgi:acetoin utilization protein AcuB
MYRARDAMAKHVIWVNANEKIERAYQYMVEFSIRHIPVVDGSNHIVGIVSQGDILRACMPMQHGVMVPNHTVETIMTRDVVTCTPGCPLGNVAATMIACKIKCIPVVDQEVPVGMITTTDVLDMFVRMEEANGHAFMPLNFVERRQIGRHT